jgi:outer membrane lipoprotein carrier protein
VERKAAARPEVFTTTSRGRTDATIMNALPNAAKSVKRTLVGALLMACAILAHANALDDLHNFAAQTKTAKGTFTQRIVSRTQKASQPTSGDFIFARPGRFRWSYTKPYEQLLVADGEKLSIYDKDLNQVTVRKLGDALGNTPAAILFGSSDLDQSFDLKDAGTRNGIAWLEASPKSRDTTFEKISIGFRNGELAAMELRDALGQVTMLDFSNVERNPKVDATTFAFTPPKGADVLQN